MTYAASDEEFRTLRKMRKLTENMDAVEVRDGDLVVLRSKEKVTAAGVKAISDQIRKLARASVLLGPPDLNIEVTRVTDQSMVLLTTRNRVPPHVTAAIQKQLAAELGVRVVVVTPDPGHAVSVKLAEVIERGWEISNLGEFRRLLDVAEALTERSQAVVGAAAATGALVARLIELKALLDKVECEHVGDTRHGIDHAAESDGGGAD